MMINHLKRALTHTILTNNKPNCNNIIFSPSYNFTTTTPQQQQPNPFIQQYRNILLKLNMSTLRNQMVQMKKVTKKNILKFKKMQIINQLCQLQQEMIKNRVLQLSNKTLLQLNSHSIYQQQTQPVGQVVTLQSQALISENHINEKKQQNKEAQFPFYQKNKTSSNILKQSLKKLLNRDDLFLFYSIKFTNQNIMDALYDDWLKKNKQLKEKLISNKQSQKTQIQQFRGQNQHYNNEKNRHKQNESIQLQRQIQKLRRKPFINRLFKTNQQLIIQQKKRKYYYEYQKSDILNQISQPILSNLKQFKKTMYQISTQRKQNYLMKGFIMKYNASKYKIYYADKQRMLRLYCAFFYYKQLIQTPHLIQFIFALTFDSKLPLEFTILKIIDEYLQCPHTFKQNLLSISKEHYLKFLKASSNYILKVFKRVDTLVQTNNMSQSQQQNTHTKNWQNKEDETTQTDDYTDDDVIFQDEQKLTKKLQSQTQKFPKSKQYIDLELVRFALSTFQVGIQRIFNELNSSQQFFINRGRFQKLQLSQNQQKQIKATHQTIILCFDLFKTIESLFASIQINDFNDLDKLSHILTSYHRIRTYLTSTISTVHKFMLNYDVQYEQKLQLGLGNITTEKELQVQNYILKNQARKLNFDIIDNIISMLKHDNLEITLENKRLNIFSVLQRVFYVYIQNDMIDFLQDDLIYNIVRFLEKQVYLDNKIRSLFDARVNFDVILMERERQMRMMRQGQQNQQIKKKKENARKQPMMETYGLNASDQYDFSNTQFTQQSSFTQSSKPTRSSSLNNDFQWFQLQSVYHSQEQTRKQYDFDTLVFEKTQKSQYFMGKISQLLSKQLLYSLIRIIKHKHDRKEIMIEQINGFNLIQQWYSQPTVVRLQFLKEEIIERYKRMSHQYQTRTKVHKNNNSRSSQL